MARLKDIAEATGFSPSVVSRALNPTPDRYTRMSDTTRQTILDAARRMGFRRNRAAEFMRRGMTPTLGVFLPEDANRLVADLIFGITEVTGDEGFPLHIDFGLHIDKFRRFLTTTRDCAHSGALCYPSLMNDPAAIEAASSFRKAGGKIVMLNTTGVPAGMTVVALDHRLGGRLAAERLIERGCARYVMLGCYVGRSEGFTQRLARDGLRLDAFKDIEQGVANVAAMAGQATLERPLGVFAVTDWVAVTVLRALADNVRRVGREVLLVGYADLAMAAYVSPPLTTVHEPFREEGRMAARMLIDMIYGHTVASQLISPWLVIRESA